MIYVDVYVEMSCGWGYIVTHEFNENLGFEFVYAWCQKYCFGLYYKIYEKSFKQLSLF